MVLRFLTRYQLLYKQLLIPIRDAGIQIWYFRVITWTLSNQIIKLKRVLRIKSENWHRLETKLDMQYVLFYLFI